MVRVITQETYDDVVKENMNDFDMTPQEAIADAILQFEAQGVNLCNIIKDLALNVNNTHLVSAALENLKKLQTQTNIEEKDIISELDSLKTECDKDLARRVRAGKEGAYQVLLDLMNRPNATTELLVKTLQTLTSLMDTQPDLLDDIGVQQMNSLLERGNSELTVDTLRWISVCCLKHEQNRQKIFESKIVGKLKRILYETKDPVLLQELLRVLRHLVLDDDIRVEFGKAHEHAREISIELLTFLTKMLTEYSSNQNLVGDLLVTISALLVRHEFCQMVEDAGGVTFILDTFVEFYDNAAMSQRALKIVKALAGNDDVKRSLVNKGSAPLIITTMNRHMGNSAIVSVALGCIAALTLREPKNSVEFTNAGAPETIIDAMKRYPDILTVQKNASWAIRNMVARSRDLNTKFLELGVEPLLNVAVTRFDKECEFDIKSALRDLGCNVKFQEQWTGKGVAMIN